jgi:predicted RNase H-like HicB family nuclease
MKFTKREQHMRFVLAIHEEKGKFGVAVPDLPG